MLFNVLRSPRFPQIAVPGSVLLTIFAAPGSPRLSGFTWRCTARHRQLLFSTSSSKFASTERGWLLIGVGCLILVSSLSAAGTLAISVVSVSSAPRPEIDGAIIAIATSIKTVRKNPIPMTLWGLIVAAALLIGSLPFFMGLTVVVPVLGHATWHLYRRVIVRDPV